jgi:hypothetical protein
MRYTSLSFSFIALAIQAVPCIHFYQYGGKDFFLMLCNDYDIVRFCLIPWWGIGVIPCFTLSLIVYSIIKFKVLDRRWWFIFLPISVILLTVVTCFTVPIIFYETVQEY